MRILCTLYKLFCKCNVNILGVFCYFQLSKYHRTICTYTFGHECAFPRSFEASRLSPTYTTNRDLPPFLRDTRGRIKGKTSKIFASTLGSFLSKMVLYIEFVDWDFLTIFYAQVVALNLVGRGGCDYGLQQYQGSGEFLACHRVYGRQVL